MHWFPLRPPDFLSKRIRRVSEFSDSREQSKTNIRLYYIPLRAARERKIVFVYSSRRPPRSTAAAFFFFPRTQSSDSVSVLELWVRSDISFQVRVRRWEVKERMWWSFFAPQQSVSDDTSVFDTDCFYISAASPELRFFFWPCCGYSAGLKLRSLPLRVLRVKPGAEVFYSSGSWCIEPRRASGHNSALVTFYCRCRVKRVFYDYLDL